MREIVIPFLWQNDNPFSKNRFHSLLLHTLSYAIPHGKRYVYYLVVKKYEEVQNQGLGYIEEIPF